MTDSECYFIGEFYANDFGPANLDLLAAFFEKHPDYAARTFLSVKVTWFPPIPNALAAGQRIAGLTFTQGGLVEGGLAPDSSYVLRFRYLHLPVRLIETH